jgi:hypothetical protein
MFAGSTTPIPLSPEDRTRANLVYDHWGQSIDSYEQSLQVSAFSSKFDAFLKVSGHVGFSTNMDKSKRVHSRSLELRCLWRHRPLSNERPSLSLAAGVGFFLACCSERIKQRCLISPTHGILGLPGLRLSIGAWRRPRSSKSASEHLECA